MKYLILVAVLLCVGCAPPARHVVTCPQCQGAKVCKPPELWIKYHPEDDKDFECPMCGGTGVMYEESPGVLRNTP